jgi:two-component system, NarL family, sensor histidine kinase UhpB
MHRPSPAWLGAALLLLPAASLAQAPPNAPPNFSALLPSLIQAAPGWLAAMLLIMALSLALLTRRQAQERHLLYLSGMMLSWLLLRASLALPPGHGPAQLALALLTLCGVQFLLRQQAWSRGWIDRALLLQCLLLPLSLFFADRPTMGWLAPAWSALLTLELLAAMGWQLRLRWLALQRAGTIDPSDPLGPPLGRDFALMSTLFGLAASALLAQQLLPYLNLPNSAAVGFGLGLALPLLMLALGLHAFVEHARARHEAQYRNVQIEQSMNEKVAEAERNFNAMADLRLEQVTERERKRIAADLHDDLGAKLLTIVHTSESDRISTLAREALEEMRLSVRGLTGKPVQLLDALGDWRAEVVSRLGQANILAEWKSPAEDVVHTLQARAYVQTTRIFREAVSNIIKHSCATHCTVSCNVQDGDFQVIIQDNGQGIPSELDGRLDRGHGMASMKSRAKQMHGQCLVESGPGWGTVIRLTIPL